MPNKITNLTARQQSLLEDYLPQMKETAFGALIDNLVKVSRGSEIQVAMLGAPVLADIDRIVVELDPIADGALTIAAQPDCPRNLTITVTDANASISAGTVTIIGEDIFGDTITDVLDLSAALTLTTDQIYAKVTSITVASLAGEEAGDTIQCGVGDKIGLPANIIEASAVKHVYLGAARQASPTVDATYNSVDASAGTYDGSKALTVWFAPGE